MMMIHLNNPLFVFIFKYRGPVYREMDVLTREFLRQISQMLHEQFAEDVSRNYLHKMVLHLQTFYEDVKGELQEKKRAVLSEIEGLFVCHYYNL